MFNPIQSPRAAERIAVIVINAGLSDRDVMKKR